MDIETLVAQHPQDVALLFKAFGYNMPVNLRNTTLFFNVNGNKEIPFNNYTDDQKPKGKLWDILGKGLDIAGKAAAIINPKKYAALSQNNQNSQNYSLPIQPESDRILGINKTLFVSLCGLLILALLLILFKKK
ncbi:hypothetical protein I5M32_11255 [Pedobacter sp. SD-b]|uniref:Short chain dehydrogenase n=1 Tax=Pedobacter segetis TaxID=2793069 RepID=A0ABS1BKX3_9SPHI|nr:hypothetical protein [Pedobacter segetis]MBK0383534.1 hypothetical protein [Pedobacter segetis]